MPTNLQNGRGSFSGEWDLDNKTLIMHMLPRPSAALLTIYIPSAHGSSRIGQESSWTDSPSRSFEGQ